MGELMRLAVRGAGDRGAVLAAIAACPGVVAGDDEAAEAIVVAGASREDALAQTRAALASGRPTLCLTLPHDLATLDDLADLAAKQGAALSLPNGLRYLPAMVALQGSVARGETGPIIGVFAAWRTNRALADPLDALGPAVFDLLGWCAPGAIARVQATAAPLFGPDRGAVALTLRGRDDLVRTVELAASLPAGFEQTDELLIEVLGEDAVLRAEPFNQAITIAGGRERRRQQWGAAAFPPILDAFVGALRDGRELPGTPAELRPTLALLAELRAAAADGLPRALD